MRSLKIVYKDLTGEIFISPVVSITGGKTYPRANTWLNGKLEERGEKDINFGLCGLLAILDDKSERDFQRFPASRKRMKLFDERLEIWERGKDGWRKLRGNVKDFDTNIIFSGKNEW